MNQRIWMAALVTALSVGVCVADEPITIVIKKPGKGDVIKETKSEDIDTTVNITVGGMTQKQEEKAVSKQVYTDEILEKGEKDTKPTKVTRTYETLEVKAGGMEVDLGLEGKTVLIEKGKDKYTFTVDGKGVSDEVQKFLDKEFNKKEDVDPEQLMLPKKAVKVGDTWDVDIKAVDKMFGEEMAVDKDAAKATGKLTKVYDKGGAKFGVMEFTIVLPIKSITTPMGALDTTEGSKLKVTMTLEGCVDGTVYDGSMSGKMEGSIGMKVPMADLSVDLNGKLSSKAELVKK